jgi:hypothetical protein
MSQLLQKSYDCMTCGQQIRISKIDNAGSDSKKKWNKFELDGKTPHVYRKGKQQQQEEIGSKDTPKKEIAAIKAQLLVVVGRLDRLEQELQK